MFCQANFDQWLGTSMHHLSHVYRGCAIPVAWVILPAGAKHAWRREWLRRLRQRHRAIPRDWTVIV